MVEKPQECKDCGRLIRDDDLCHAWAKHPEQCCQCFDISLGKPVDHRPHDVASSR